MFYSVNIINIFYHLYIGVLCGLTLSLNTFIFGCMIMKQGFSVVYLGYAYLSLLPYSLSFLWAYIFDFYTIRLFGLDAIKSWLLCVLVCLASSLLYMGSYLNDMSFVQLVVCNFFICFFSVSKDVLLGYWRVNMDLNSVKNSNYYSIGYRIGMMLIVFLSLNLGLHNLNLSWSEIYIYFAFLFIFLMLIFLYCTANYQILRKDRVDFSIWRGFIKYRYILLALFLYNLSDRLIMSVLKKFLIDYGFLVAEIGWYKIYATIGLLLGYWLVSYINLSVNKLFYMGMFHAVIHVLLYVHALIGKSPNLHMMIVILESITGGICMALYIGYIAKNTNSVYIYSLLSSVMGISNALLPTVAGYLVYYYNWQQFFLITFVLGVISVYLSYYLLSYKHIKD